MIEPDAPHCLSTPHPSSHEAGGIVMHVGCLHKELDGIIGVDNRFAQFIN